MKNYYLFSWAFVSSLAYFQLWKIRAKKKGNKKRATARLRYHKTEMKFSIQWKRRKWNGIKLFFSWIFYLHLMHRKKSEPSSGDGSIQCWAFLLTPPDLTQLIRDVQNGLVFLAHLWTFSTLKLSPLLRHKTILNESRNINNYSLPFNSIRKLGKHFVLKGVEGAMMRRSL